MKIYALALSALAAFALTACGGEEHAHVKAVDKVEEAQAAALAKAPKAEEIIFDDHGQKPFAEPKKPEEAADAAKAEEAPAADAKAEEPKADAAAPAEAPKAEEAPAADAKKEDSK